MLEPSSVVLGQCDLCKQDVAHDEWDAELVYDKTDLLKLERVFCGPCAAKCLGGLPHGMTEKEFAAFLVRMVGPRAEAAAETIARRLAAGEHVPSGEMVELLGLTPTKQRRMSNLTTAGERLRRHREAAGRPKISRRDRRRLRHGRGVNKRRGGAF